MDIDNRLQTISLLVVDVDGVLTDGRIGYGAGADEEIKFFDVKDGKGIRLLAEVGIKTCVLSGRGSRANRIRFTELGITSVYEEIADKRSAFITLLHKEQVSPRDCLYIGDDLMDIGPMQQAGVGVCVADAVPEVIAAADWCTSRPGGRGAVREVADRVLKAQEKWKDIRDRYVSSPKTP